MSDNRLYKRIYQLLLQLHTEPTARMLAEKWTREMTSEAQWDHFLDGMTESQRAGYFQEMAAPQEPPKRRPPLRRWFHFWRRKKTN